MEKEPTTSERVWRAIALLLFAVLLWQGGNPTVSSESSFLPGVVVERGESSPRSLPIIGEREIVPELRPRLEINGGPVVDSAPPEFTLDSPRQAPTSTPAHTPEYAPPTPAPTPTAEPTPAPPQERRIGNTGGEGVYLRASPRLDDRLRPWVDDTVMVLTGAEADGDGQHWLQVRDPDGTIGWVPAEYLR